MENPKKAGYWLRFVSLCFFSRLTCYRFDKWLKDDPLKRPSYLMHVEVREIQEKARASLNTSGVFFGFTIAVLAVLIGFDAKHALVTAMKDLFLSARLAFGVIASLVVPCSVIWAQRYITQASTKEKNEKDKTERKGYALLKLSLIFALFFFLAVPSIWKPANVILQQALPLAGFFLMILSALFLLFSLELYDSASGWRGGDNYHFHLASLGSHLSLLGFPLAAVGLSLLFCLLDFWLGRVVTCLTLVGYTGLIESERRLWRIRDK